MHRLGCPLEVSCSSATPITTWLGRTTTTTGRAGSITPSWTGRSRRIALDQPAANRSHIG
jgi:hypothetical protein